MSEENIPKEKYKDFNKGKKFKCCPWEAYIEARKDEGLTLGKNWHNILMCVDGTLIFFWISHKLDHIVWETDPEFYIGLLALTIDFLGYYFKQK